MAKFTLKQYGESISGNSLPTNAVTLLLPRPYSSLCDLQLTRVRPGREGEHGHGGVVERLMGRLSSRT